RDSSEHDIFVALKPAGWSVAQVTTGAQASAGEDLTLGHVDFVLGLDAPSSGLVLGARRSAALFSLAGQLGHGILLHEYVVLCCGLSQTRMWDWKTVAHLRGSRVSQDEAQNLERDLYCLCVVRSRLPWQLLRRHLCATLT
ncbi:unnamed protein product, partial [Polarella glacialis]